VQEGTEVRAGQTIVNIGDASNLWLEAHVDRAQKSKLRLGAFAAYTIDNHKYQGTILDIVDPQDEDNAAAQTDDAVDDKSAAASADNKDADHKNSSMNTEGKAPVIDPARLTVRISMPTDTDIAFKPGTSPIIKLSI
jgi:membrane fusion protein (multidrug efflux system)